MKNNITLLTHDKCTGCGACEVVCPTYAIKINQTIEGFYNPQLSDEKCINCGLCIKICIKFDDIKKDDNHKKILSAKNKDKNVLNKSTSGGVSYELMKKCIEDGYKIVGVAYDEISERATTKIVKEIEELEIFYGSKYMESYTVESLKKIFSDKTDQKYAIFGTPCQIYSFKKFAQLKNQDKKFLLVDLFCHGCPSINVWKKYLQMNKVKYKCQDFEKIEFRSKVHGWHEQSFKFIKNKKEYPSNRLKNEFNDLFFNLDVLNKACYNCEIRSSLNYTDIRLGDFWGSEYDDDKEGVSAVVLVSDKGKNIFDSIAEKFYLKEHKIEEVLPGQSYGKKHILKEEKRDNLLNMLKSDLTIEEIHRKYIKSLSLKKRIKISITKILKLLPKDIFFKLRKLKFYYRV